MYAMNDLNPNPNNPKSVNPKSRQHSITNAGYIHKEITFALDAADLQPEETIFIIDGGSWRELLSWGTSEAPLPGWERGLGRG
jgi:hypothetical protein